MNKSTNYYKVAVFGAAIIILILVIRSCGAGKDSYFGCGYKKDTAEIRIDTFVVRGKSDTVYVPQVTTITTVKYKPFWRHDTLETFEIIIVPTDTVAILKDYFATRFYADTQIVKRGTVIIQDSVTQNRIVSRRLQTFLHDTTIVQKIILTQPKKFILYLDLQAMGNRKELLNGAGAGLSLKGRNDMQYGAGIWWLNQKQTFYSLKVSLPIRLSKNR